MRKIILIVMATLLLVGCSNSENVAIKEENVSGKEEKNKEGYVILSEGKLEDFVNSFGGDTYVVDSRTGCLYWKEFDTYSNGTAPIVSSLGTDVVGCHGSSQTVEEYFKGTKLLKR